MLIVAACCQRGLIKVYCCAMNWTVVGRTKLTTLATVDDQFITLLHVARVHLQQLILVDFSLKLSL